MYGTIVDTISFYIVHIYVRLNFLVFHVPLLSTSSDWVKHCQLQIQSVHFSIRAEVRQRVIASRMVSQSALLPVWLNLWLNIAIRVLLILNICRLQSGSVKIPLQITTKSKHGTTKSYITMSSYSNMTKHNNNPTNGTSPTYEETDMITNGDNSNSPSSPTSNQQFKTTKFSGKKTLTSTSSWPLQKANKSCHFSDDDFLWIVE